MAWLLTILLFFIILSIGISIGIKKLIPVVTKNIDKRDIDRRVKLIEREIEVKEYERDALGDSLGDVMELTELNHDIEKLKDIKEETIKEKDNMMFIAKYISCLMGVILVYGIYSLFGTESFVEIMTSYKPYMYALTVTIILIIIEHIQNQT